jgi:hypothetical protein
LYWQSDIRLSTKINAAVIVQTARHVTHAKEKTKNNFTAFFWKILKESRYLLGSLIIAQVN